MSKSIEQVRRRAKPIEEAWLRDVISESLTGIPWHQQDAANPRQISIEQLMQKSIWTKPALGALVLLLLLGAWRLWRQDPFLAIVCGTVLVSGLVATLHFKYGLRVELLTWYLLYNLPILAVAFSSALSPSPALQQGRTVRRFHPKMEAAGWGLASLAGLAGSMWLGSRMVRDFQRHPRENLKRAWKMTRAVHEPRGFSKPSNIYTGWLWRHTHAYDPRADMYFRTREKLEEKVRLAQGTGGEFYMIVGIRELSDVVCREVMTELRNPDRFEHMATLWGVESLNTLDVYHLKKRH